MANGVTSVSISDGTSYTFLHQPLTPTRMNNFIYQSNHFCFSAALPGSQPSPVPLQVPTAHCSLTVSPGPATHVRPWVLSRHWYLAEMDMGGSAVLQSTEFKVVYHVNVLLGWGWGVFHHEKSVLEHLGSQFQEGNLAVSGHFFHHTQSGRNGTWSRTVSGSAQTVTGLLS